MQKGVNFVQINHTVVISRHNCKQINCCSDGYHAERWQRVDLPEVFESLFLPPSSVVFCGLVTYLSVSAVRDESHCLIRF